MKLITVAQVEEIAYQMARRQMDWDEPIPDFGTRFPGKLESCLVQVFQTYAKRDLYPGLIKKAAALFYFVIKNHPFVNGNKRIGVATMITFLLLNRKWLTVPNDQLYELAIWVAKSDPKLKDEVISYTEAFIRRSLTTLS